METENNATSLRVASFSCYLDTADTNFMHKIKKALEDPTPHSISSPEKSFPIHNGRSKPPLVRSSPKNNNNHISHSPRVASFSHYLNNSSDENFLFKFTQNLEKAKVKDGEIDIFGADKYFKMKLDGETQPYINTKTSSNLTHEKRSKFGPGTPSNNSEASSWNSQTALLNKLHYQRTTSDQVKQKKALGMRFLNSFACTGPCLDKKSVNINQSSTGHGIVQSTNGQSKEGSRLEKAEIFSLKLEDQPRESLEVFGSKEMRKGDSIAENLGRKVSILSWDAIPKAQSFTTTTQKSSSLYDDMASEASSDLFEIENISGNGYGLLTENETENLSSCMSPTPYAPSEVSIEWSVVTASAAEFSSVLSDNYEGRSVSVAGDLQNRGEKSIKSALVRKGGQKSNKTGGFLGCKSLKSVSVAGTHVLNTKNVDQKGKNNGVDLNASLSKLQGSAKVKDMFTPR